MMRGWIIFFALLLIAPVLAAAPACERWSNGFRLIILPTTSSQVVSAEVLIDYSALDEPVEQPGNPPGTAHQYAAGFANLSMATRFGAVSPPSAAACRDEFTRICSNFP